MSGPIPSRAERRGLSLAETVIAIFLLLCASMVVIALFHSSLRYSAKILVQSSAARVAEKHLAIVRSWARQKVGTEYNFEDPARWASRFPGTAAPDGEEPEFTVRVRQQLQTLYSPCSQLENNHGPQAREFNQSFRRVTVTVSWNPPRPENRLSITSLVGSPPRRFPGNQTARNTKLTVTPRTPVGVLPFRGKYTFDAELVDTDGNVIPDVCFAWHVIPGLGGGTTGSGLTASGNGIIDPNDPDTLRSGRSATFLNNYPLYANAWSQSVAGTVAVGCVARYRGLQAENRSQVWENE